MTDHDHSCCGHDHSHDHGHEHAHAGPPARGFAWRLAIAGLLAVAALLAATLVTVRAGTAAVTTRFGDPVRISTEPGLTVRWPAPIERVTEIDLRLRTTATGLHSVQTKDGLSLVVQAHAAWRVRPQADSVAAYLRAVGGDPDQAAVHLRTFLDSALETVTGRFALADLVNTDAAQVKLADYEAALRSRLVEQMLATYGVEVVQVGLERLALPEATVGATINRMAEERKTAAEERKAAGTRQAAEIRSAADRDARIAKARAEEESARVQAEATAKAAAIYGAAHSADPQLYAYLRGLETLEAALGGSTRLILRTDAAPFSSLVAPPPAPAGTATGVKP